MIQKSGHDLLLTPDLDEEHFWLAALGLGYLRNFGSLAGFLPGVGARGNLGLVPSGVEPFYGTRAPVGGMVFLRVVVAPMAKQSH